MKKVIAFVCLIMLVVGSLSSCVATCEYCEDSVLFTNQVGDSENGINVCNTCLDKYMSRKISFVFTCANCEKELSGKKNPVVIDGETVDVCNTCFKNFN